MVLGWVSECGLLLQALKGWADMTTHSYTADLQSQGRGDTEHLTVFRGGLGMCA